VTLLESSAMLTDVIQTDAQLSFSLKPRIGFYNLWVHRGSVLGQTDWTSELGSGQHNKCPPWR